MYFGMDGVEYSPLLHGAMHLVALRRRNPPRSWEEGWQKLRTSRPMNIWMEMEKKPDQTNLIQRIYRTLDV